MMKFSVEKGCSSNPCLNGGDCYQTHYNGSYRCSCSGNYTGLNCESSEYIQYK